MRRPSSGLLHHSDRGVQYACDEYQALLSKHRVQPSMSRKGNCWDNAVVESFFSTLKTEAQIRVFDYIEAFYNRRRRLVACLSESGRVRTSSKPVH
jgi:transposase InsO family protein